MRETNIPVHTVGGARFGATGFSEEAGRGGRVNGGGEGRGIRVAGWGLIGLTAGVGAGVGGELGGDRVGGGPSELEHVQTATQRSSCLGHSV